MSSCGGRGRGGRSGWRSGRWAPWKRGRSIRGANTSNSILMAPSYQSSTDFDSADDEGRIYQSTQNSSLGKNCGQLLGNSSAAAGTYPGWDLYFPFTSHEDESAVAVKVKHFLKYFKSWSSQYVSNLEEVLAEKFVEIFYSDVVDHAPLREKYPNIVEDFRESPETLLSCVGLAFHTFVFEHLNQMAIETKNASMNKRPLFFNPVLIKQQLPKINVRISGYQNMTKLRELRHNVYGRFITVKGSVVRVSNVRPFTTRLVFECGICKQLQLLPLPDGRYVLPSKCASHGCRGKSFTPIAGHKRNESIEWQTVKIQETADEMEKTEDGHIPRTIECELTSGLVHSCIPGDLVTITGVVKLINSEQSKKAREKSLFMVYILANNVYNHKAKMKKKMEANDSKRNSFEKTILEIESSQRPFAIREDSCDSTVSYEHSTKEMEFVSEFFDVPNKFQILVASFCPSIYGHEIIKASLLLGLVSGCQKFVDDPSRVPVRGDPHILIVGDPGLGKSQMLQAASQVAPRSVFVCGNTSTTAGLTVSITREGHNGDLALEAGALVLADQGCCCIDEFDKMSSQHQALLEAMEQQCISISKSGVIASLPARTSVLAAANPVGGHYNRAKTVAENVRMSSALLSRFDLVFLLLDKPDEEMDHLLSEHVMKLHSKSGRNNLDISMTDSHNSSIASRPSQSVLTRLWQGKKPLQDRLKIPRGAEVDLLPPRLLKSWIAYAKKYVVDVSLSAEAKSILKDYYLKLRGDHHTKDSTPITTRQLEAMIRLTEARAKLDLVETATSEHAQDVVDLMNVSMLHTQSDPFGSLDFERSQHGSGTSVRTLQKKLLQLLLREKRQTGSDIISMDRIRALAPECPQIRNVVAALNRDGHLIQKRPGLYKIESD